MLLLKTQRWQQRSMHMPRHGIIQALCCAAPCGSLGHLFERLLEALRISTPEEASDLKPYTLRRGGATFHVVACGSMDVVMARGRRAQLRTARIYITTGLLPLTDASYDDEVEALLCKTIPRLRLPSP